MVGGAFRPLLSALVLAVTVASYGWGALNRVERLGILWDRAIRQTDFGKLADTEASACLALRIAPDRAGLCEGFARAHGMRAWALWDLGRHDEAVAQTREAIRLEPRGFYWQQNLAIMLGALGKLDAALEESAQALELAPSDQWKAVAHNNRAYLHAYSDELAEALAAAEAALALSPDDPAVLDTAGPVCALGGQLGRAEGYLRRALAGGYASLPKLAYALALRGDDSGAREAQRQLRGDLLGPTAPWTHFTARGCRMSDQVNPK